MAFIEESKKTKKAIKRYGYGACVKAFEMHQAGEGAATIAQTHPDDRIRTTRQADAAINAGRELAKISEHCANHLRVTRPQPMTTTETLDKAAKFFGTLYDRWRDESQYEDINDYAKAMKHHLPAGTTIESISKSPFKLVFTINGTRYFLRANASQVVLGTFQS